MKSANNNTTTGKHQNRQGTHSAHSSISITRLNRDKSKSAKPDLIGSGNHRRDKNYNIFKDNNVIYITKNPSEISHQERRKSDQTEHIKERQSHTSQSNIKTTDNNQLEYNETENSNRKKSFSSNISRNIQIQLKSVSYIFINSLINRLKF
jgi:hypothetical protein